MPERSPWKLREADDLPAAGVHLRHLERDLVRLRARVQEQDAVERRRKSPTSRSSSASTGSESIHEFRWTTSSSAERTAAAMRGWLWPSVEQICPDVKSRIFASARRLDPRALRRAIGSGEGPRVADEEALALVHGARIRCRRGEHLHPRPRHRARRAGPRDPGRALPGDPSSPSGRPTRTAASPTSAARSLFPTSTASSSTRARPSSAVEVEVELGEGTTTSPAPLPYSCAIYRGS